jgi:CRISPR-associated protein Csx1
MSNVSRKALLIATWGLPLTWSCVKYIPPKLGGDRLCERPSECEYAQDGKYSFSSTSVIYEELLRGGWDVRVVIVGQDTLVARCQGQGSASAQGKDQCSGMCNDEEKRRVDDEYCNGNNNLFEKVKGSGSINYEELLRRAEDVLRSYARVLLGGDVESRLRVVVLPGVGHYNGYRFEGFLENAKFVLMKELYEELSAYKPSVVVLDITHGVNYMPTLTYNAVTILGRALYVTEGLPRQVVTLNSDPVASRSRCGDVRINVVDVMDMDKEGVTISDVLRSIGKFEGAILNIQPQTDAAINEELRALRKDEMRLGKLSKIYVELISKALDYGMMLYIATRLTQKEEDFEEFKSLVYDKMTKADNVIKRYVNIKYEAKNDSVVVSRTFVVNSDLVLQYVATEVLEHVKCVTKCCRVEDGYDLRCLSDLVDSLKVSDFARTIFKNEVDILTKNYGDKLTGKPKLLCEVMGHSDCKECSANKRDLIAHAGLERNVTYVYKQGDRVLAKYGEKCLEEIEHILGG